MATVVTMCVVMTADFSWLSGIVVCRIWHGRHGVGDIRLRLAGILTVVACVLGRCVAHRLLTIGLLNIARGSIQWVGHALLSAPAVLALAEVADADDEEDFEDDNADNDADPGADCEPDVLVVFIIVA